MNTFINEYKRYKKLLESSVAQVSEEDFFKHDGGHDNSIAVIVKHLSGNFLSRFTDFLTTDGEKDWRDRELEFDVGKITKAELMNKWQEAWHILEDAVFSLIPEDMQKTVTIRGVQFTIEEALARSLSHFSYHVGQIAYLAKHFVGDNWKYLSIPPGESSNYNKNPSKERGI